jgi:hypothetical protein
MNSFKIILLSQCLMSVVNCITGTESILQLFFKTIAIVDKKIFYAGLMPYFRKSRGD